MPNAKLFCTPLGTVLFLYQGERPFNQTPCHCWQVAIQDRCGNLWVTGQVIPCEANREPGSTDAESVALIAARRAGRH